MYVDVVQSTDGNVDLKAQSAIIDSAGRVRDSARPSPPFGTMPLASTASDQCRGHANRSIEVTVAAGAAPTLSFLLHSCG